MKRPQIVLIGMRASGKSTLGKKLAAHLGFIFQDVDSLIQKDRGLSILDIFSTEGITQFRTYELTALKQALEQDNTVISTGGGCVEIDELPTLLSKCCVIHLFCPRNEAIERLRTAPRPPLSNAPLSKEYDSVYERRERLYRELGGSPVLTGGVTLEESLNACKQLWHKYYNNHLR